MDYIIFGIGAGATLVLTGWLLREWGPRIRDRKPAEDEILSASEMVTRMAWTRFCATCGMALVLGGLSTILATLAVLFVAPSDDRGAMAVMVAFGVAAILMLIWTALYLRQFGAMGVLRPKEKTALSSAPASKEPLPEPVATEVAGPAPADIVPPSFADAAASPGGLGRFAAFFRRDTPSSTTSEVAPVTVPIPEGSSSPSELATAPAATAMSPTDAVIAELEGGTEENVEKKLSPNDPLVTSIQREDASDMEAELVAEMFGQGSALAEPTNSVDLVDSRGGDDLPTPGTELPEEDSAEAPASEHVDQDVALGKLRRRRLERLSKDNPTS